jgi:hypothetical protein
MTEEDVIHLRSHDFSDAQVTIAVQVIGYFNYINRIADGLNVDPEDWMTPGAEEWKATKAKDFHGAAE